MFEITAVQAAPFTVIYLDKIEQTPETPGHRVEPLWAGIRPSGVDQLGQVTVREVAAATANSRVVLLGDVAGGEVANTKEVAGTLDVALLLGREVRQARCSEALLYTLPSCRGNKTYVSISFLPKMNIFYFIYTLN